MINSILAGPILRRTTKNRVCVWLALESEQNLSLEILDIKNKTPIGRSRPEDLKSSHFQLGNNLYVYLLQAFPLDTNAQFNTETLFYYQLLDDQSKPLDLKAAGLTYGKHPHPIFHIPDSLHSVLHGSCRKPHGAKGVDSITVGDSLLEEFHKDVKQRDIKQRPDLLLLTGDQIYADDVDASLLKTLREQAINLLGHSETLPSGNANQPIVTPDKILLGGRTDILKLHKSGFSSTAADNHLMSFGEFAAMYIYVFGNAKNWPTPSTWQEIKADHVAVENDKQTELETSIAAVVDFGKTLGKVRRLMANIPTYMIFDDHDVTDDWNITGHWYDTVRSSSLGRRIVSNALAAYWAFQGWGNDPDNFDTDMIASITRHLNQTGLDLAGDERYDLLTWKHRGWSFSIPTNPPIIAMDSRTQRQPDNAYYPPRLLDRYALDWLRVEWSKLKTSNNIDNNSCPIFIATTPVLGFSPIEDISQAALWAAGVIEDQPAVHALESLINQKGFLGEYLVNSIDAEAWTANLDGFTDYLDTLLHKMAIDKCLFLSGDVHYSFSATGFYKSNSGYSQGARQLACCQLTSSSLRNIPAAAQRKALETLQKLEDPKTSKSNWWRFYASRWQVEHTLLSSDTNERIVETCNLGQVKFEQGTPVKHILWLDPNKSVEYVIPKF
jgi:hypothetical protein